MSDCAYVHKLNAALVFISLSIALIQNVLLSFTELVFARGLLTSFEAYCVLLRMSNTL